MHASLEQLWKVEPFHTTLNALLSSLLGVPFSLWIPPKASSGSTSCAGMVNTLFKSVDLCTQPTFSRAFLHGKGLVTFALHTDLFSFGHDSDLMMIILSLSRFLQAED